VNYPFDPGGVLTQGVERGRVSQRLEFTGEAERSLAERLSEVAQEGFAEAAAEETHGEKERRLSAGDPARAIGRDASAGHDAMQVGVQMQVLTPGMEHGQEADGCAQESRVCRSLQQSLGGGAEQDGVGLSVVLKRQAADLIGQSEHDVEIGDREKLGLPLLEPSCACRGLALWAMAIAAGVI
jgi:hypothetical protein